MLFGSTTNFFFVDNKRRGVLLKKESWDINLFTNCTKINTNRNRGSKRETQETGNGKGESEGSRLGN